MSNKKIDVYTPYQQKTINHILDTFQKSTRNRMLCADEVGLGKTFVAKGVIRGMAWDYLQKGKERLDVLYLCSNMNIANQNKRELGLQSEEDSNKSGSKEENRTSMLYLQVLKGCVKELSEEELAAEYMAATGKEVKVNQSGKKIAVSVLPITPDTSLNIHSRPMGTAREREYILRVLKMYGLWTVNGNIEDIISEMGNYSSNSIYGKIFKGFHKKYYDIQEQKKWEDEKKSFCHNITIFGEKLSEYKGEIENALSVIKNGNQTNVKDSEDYKEAWKRLREIFSSVTLDLIHYDVVILDEFQNFTKIIEKANSNAIRRNYRHNQKLFICKLLEQIGLKDSGYIKQCKKNIDGFDKELEVDSNKYSQIISQYSIALSESDQDEWRKLSSEEELIDKAEELCLDIVTGNKKSQGGLPAYEKKKEAWRIACDVFFRDTEKIHASKDSVEQTKRNDAYGIKVSEKMEILWEAYQGKKEDSYRTFFAWYWLEVVGTRYDIHFNYMKPLYEVIRDSIKKVEHECETYYLDNTPKSAHPYQEINAWLVDKIKNDSEHADFFRKVRVNLELYRNSLLSQNKRNDYLLDYFVLAEYLQDEQITDITFVDVSSLELIYQFQWLKYFCEKHRDIYTLQDDSEAELLDNIFAAEIPAEGDDTTKILMLSATPFRLYMGGDDEETDQPKETVEAICDFLQRSGEIRENLQAYKREIKAFSRDVMKNDTKDLYEKKNRFEESMHCYFTRMERNAVLRKLGGFDSNAENIEQEEVVNNKIGELATYTEQLGILLGNSAAAVRYGIQMPYALSFMPGSGTGNDVGYKIKKAFTASWETLSQPKSDYSILDKNAFDNFAEPMGLFHGVFRDMLYSVLNLEDTQENENKPGAGKLLWIPPLAVEMDNLKGAFKENYGYGKTILFSSWIMVPRGIAVLFSHEVRRRLLHAVFPGWNGIKEEDRKNYIEKIQAIKDKVADAIKNKNYDCEGFFWGDESNIICMRRRNLWYRLLSADITSVLAVWAECGAEDLKYILGILNREEKKSFENDDLSTDDKKKIIKMIKTYSENGCLDKVLDEYDYMERKIDETFEFIKSTKLSITMREQDELEDVAQDNFFARSIGSSKGDDEVNAIENLQKAFNSPFAPFVFATTSMGQEGLDFHNYADRIIHWNLPSNPVDFEQREGRINRRNCFAIRKKLIEVYAQDYIQTGCSVKEIFDNAFNKVLEQDFMKRSTDELVHCGMVPNWILPYKDEDTLKVAKIQRIVPYFTTSNVMIKYHNNLKVLQLYRSVIGQPDPEELMERLLGRENGEEIVKELFMDFSPYRNNKETT